MLDIKWIRENKKEFNSLKFPLAYPPPVQSCQMHGRAPRARGGRGGAGGEGNRARPTGGH